MKTGTPAACHPPGVVSEAKACVRQAGHTVVVIDDDPAVLRALDRLIRSRGSTAHLFSSPAEFLAAADLFSDCLIVDVQMPGMSGLELHKRLLEEGRRTPVIFVTAHEDPLAVAEATRLGAAGFFYKPFHNEALWAAVLSAVKEQGPTAKQ